MAAASTSLQTAKKAGLKNSRLVFGQSFSTESAMTDIGTWFCWFVGLTEPYFGAVKFVASCMFQTVALVVVEENKNDVSVREIMSESLCLLMSRDIRMSVETCHGSDLASSNVQSMRFPG